MSYKKVYQNAAQIIDDTKLEVERLHKGDVLAGATLAINLVTDALIQSDLLNVRASPWLPMSRAHQDGTSYICLGQHITDAPPYASPMVKQGDLWVAMLVFDVWRDAPLGQRWVFTLNGAAAWSKPLLFKHVDWPTLEEFDALSRTLP